MVRSLPDGVSAGLIAQARENPYGELAWRYPAIIEVVAVLAASGYAILGGDVMYADDDEPLDYYDGEIYCGNWYRDWKKPEESWADYIAASVAVTNHYIEAYFQRNGDAYWFVPSFIHEQGYQTLSRHKA